MTNISKRTPGPWAYERTSGAIYYADGDVEPVIAGINQDGTSEKQADADGYLIAASPDLYGVAELFKQSLEYMIARDERDGDDEGARLKTATLREVRAALTKARGEVS